jgi:hypothetical protein
VDEIHTGADAQGQISNFSVSLTGGEGESERKRKRDEKKGERSIGIKSEREKSFATSLQSNYKDVLQPYVSERRAYRDDERAFRDNPGTAILVCAVFDPRAEVARAQRQDYALALPWLEPAGF